MNKDVRIGTSYPDHPKRKKLEKRLGAEGVVSHIDLLCYVARITPNGVLEDMDGEDIALAARWKGDAKEFVDTLVDLRLLNTKSETYSIHDWLDWNQFAASAPIRSRIARANIRKRWDKKKEIIQQDNTDGITDCNTDSNTPSPSPSTSPRREGEGVRKDFALGEQSFPPSPKDLKSYLDWQQSINEQSDPDLRASWQKMLDKEVATLSEEEQERIAIMGESIKN